MGIKSALARPIAAFAVMQINKWRNNALSAQEKVFRNLIRQARNTVFGKDHNFSKISTYDDYKNHIPVKDYEGLKPYIERVVAGEANVLWPGKPQYLAKTSGTTSGTKYIPISKLSMPEHLKAARNALLCYIHETGKSDFVDGRLIFLQGSPVLEIKNGIAIGRLSGIVANHVPAYLQKNRLPSYKTNSIEDWEEKIEAIVDETISEDMRLISGIPPWVQMYFDRLAARSDGKKIKDIFKNFSLFVHGGVNFEPYRARLEESIGKRIDSIETYPASEGFIAFQDSQKEKGLLLLVNSGIFYEFIPSDEYYNENPARISLKDVELDKNYALILNTNAGLWGYSIGDTIKFVSKNPYRIIVTGRIKHYISAFGEHVIGEEVEYAILSVAKEENVEITEFTVAPQVNPETNAEGSSDNLSVGSSFASPEGTTQGSIKGLQLPYHEWYVEFAKAPVDLKSFSMKVDKSLQQRNSYYFDLIEGKVLQPLVMHELKKDAFRDYMKQQGKLGGQNKVPRLSNDRLIADELNKWISRKD